MHTLTMPTTIKKILTTSTKLIPTKTVMSAAMICSIIISRAAIKILATLTTMVQTTTTSKILIQGTILVMSSFAIISNAIKSLI